jgi:hypothetical protein
MPLGAASSNYSASLTDKQQNACIAAGAKVRSRPRLGQWGWLTGQQYWVGQECTRKAEPVAQNAEKLTEGLQTKEISLPSWETRRSTTVVAPGQHRRDTRPACPRRSKSGIRSPKHEANPNAERSKAPSRVGARVPVILVTAPRVGVGCLFIGRAVTKYKRLILHPLPRLPTIREMESQ